jgi:hypothetical protein
MVLSKTALGSQVMKDRSIGLSAQQRSALILCDGKRSAEEVVRMTAGVGVGMEDIEALVSLGLVESIAATHPEKAVATGLQSPSQVSNDQKAVPEVDFSAAINAAISLCANLGFKGFGLNMALTGVDSLEKLQKLAPEIRSAAGDAKYKALHPLIFGKPL